MVQIIEANDIGEKIGKAFGQGLSDQIPKEYGRIRQGQRLDDFMKQRSGQSPLEQGVSLLKSGLTPEAIYALQPLLEREGAINEAKRNLESGKIPTGGKIPEKTPFPIEKPPGITLGKPGLTEKAPEKRITTPEGFKKIIEPFVPKTADELKLEADQEYLDNPYTIKTRENAFNFVTNRENIRKSNYEQEQSALLRGQDQVAKLRSNIEGKLSNKLQKSPKSDQFYRQVPATILERMSAEAERKLSDPKNKKSNEQIEDEVTNDLFRVGQAQKNVESRARESLFSGEYSPKKINDTIDGAREAYKKVGGLEEFADSLVADMGMTQSFANYKAMPPENKEMNKWIKSQKKPDRFSFSIDNLTNPNKLAIQAADQFSNVAKDNDSILSYATQLKALNINPRTFVDRINENKRAGLFKPSEFHNNELQKGYQFPSLADAWIMTITDNDKLLE